MPVATWWSASKIQLTDDQSRWLSKVWEDHCWNYVGLDVGSMRSSRGEVDNGVSEESDDDGHNDDGREEGSDSGQSDTTSGSDNERKIGDNQCGGQETVAEGQTS